MVGTVRFELTASCSQSRRANQTTLRPVKKRVLKECKRLGKEISTNLLIYYFLKLFRLRK